jgi:site-specific recombinase XerD
LKRVRRSINRFVEYLGQKGLFGPVPHSEIFAPLLVAYLEWMKHYQHAAAGTLELRAQYLTVFLRWLGSEATPQGLAKLCPEKAEAFFLAYAQKVGKAARRSMQSTLRTFLRFCLHQGYVQQPLDVAVPTLRTYKLASVPVGLTEAQARQILQGIDRKTAVGRRDYAIIQLLFTYGVRGGQVRVLRLEQIDWAQNRILFAASKGGKNCCLPLMPEVGQSLLDYLQNARPPSSDPQVFLTSRAPYHPLARSSSLSAIIERRIRAAGIAIPSKGAHVFRHGFATRMLAQGQPLKAIADVLGHRHLGTTFIYTKVDFNALKQVALEWPKEVRR